jgi:hypothetical protein
VTILARESEETFEVPGELEAERQASLHELLELDAPMPLTSRHFSRPASISLITKGRDTFKSAAARCVSQCLIWDQTSH